MSSSIPNPTVRLRIYQSREVQRRWKMAPARLPEVLSDHWLQTWRLDFLKRASSPVFLVTNEETLYTWVFPKPEVPNHQAFERLFRIRLGSALTDYPNQERWGSAPIDYVSGNPRRLIGVMNNMADHLVWRGSGPTDDEQVLNTTPFQGQLEGRPERAFWGRLRLDRDSETARTTPTIDSYLLPQGLKSKTPAHPFRPLPGQNFAGLSSSDGSTSRASANRTNSRSVTHRT